DPSSPVGRWWEPRLFHFFILISFILTRAGVESCKNQAELAQEETMHRTLLVPSADRKSTRLNSSHVSTSYAVFCLKKKKHTGIEKHRPQIADLCILPFPL